MRKNIFAYTPPGFAPPYLSINQEENGLITVMVRSECGDHAGMIVPLDELAKLAAAVSTFCFPLQSRSV